MTNDAQYLRVQHRPRSARLAEVAPPVPVDSFAQRLQQVAEAAYVRGREDGERVVAEQLLQQRKEIRELQERVLAPLRQVVAKVISDTEQQVVALALEVGQRLVSGLPIDAEMVKAAVREALEQAKDTSQCHVYLHPADLRLLEECNGGAQEFTAGKVSGTSLHFHATEEVERGGCVVKTRFGTIDAQRGTKVEQLRKTVLQ